ncbi:MAG: radical SAM protein [bacterium]
MKMTVCEYSHQVFELESALGRIAFIPTLRQAMLIPEGVDIPKNVLSEIPTPESLLSPSSRPSPTHATLSLTENCNLRCWYCFADGGKGLKELPLDAGRAVIDRIAKNALKRPDKKFMVHFFGGEPTLVWRKLLSLDKYARQIAEKYGLVYTSVLTTNGLMSQKKREWIVSNISDRVTVSIDGLPELQNFQRPLPNGEGSWEKVIKTVRFLYQTIPDKLLFRITVTDVGVERIPEIVQYLADNFPGVPQSYEPSSGNGRVGSPIQEPNSMRFVQKFFEGYELGLSLGVSLRTSIVRLGLVGLSFCGACGYNLTITPDGRLTSCQRMVDGEYSNTSLVYGFWDSVSGELIIDQKIQDQMLEISVQNIKQCADCFAKYSCRGDCLAIKAARGIDYQNEPSYRCDAIRWLIARMIERKLIKASTPECLSCV